MKILLFNTIFIVLKIVIFCDLTIYLFFESLNIWPQKGIIVLSVANAPPCQSGEIEIQRQKNKWQIPPKNVNTPEEEGEKYNKIKLVGVNCQCFSSPEVSLGSHRLQFPANDGKHTTCVYLSSKTASLFFASLPENSGFDLTPCLLNILSCVYIWKLPIINIYYLPPIHPNLNWLHHSANRLVIFCWFFPSQMELMNKMCTNANTAAEILTDRNHINKQKWSNNINAPHFKSTLQFILQKIILPTCHC